MADGRGTRYSTGGQPACSRGYPHGRPRGCVYRRSTCNGGIGEACATPGTGCGHVGGDLLPGIRYPVPALPRHVEQASATACRGIRCGRNLEAPKASSCQVLEASPNVHTASRRGTGTGCLVAAGGTWQTVPEACLRTVCQVRRVRAAKLAALALYGPRMMLILLLCYKGGKPSLSSRLASRVHG